MSEPLTKYSAYYYSFSATGDPYIDAILEAVARAGKMYHNTADWDEDVIAAIQTVANEAREAHKLTLNENEALRKALNTPEILDFMAGVPLEAAHQRDRWGSDHDAGKTAADWFWLVGYLAGKALHSETSGNHEKALHHVITTAAALANWHSAILGTTNMRPGTGIAREAK